MWLHLMWPPNVFLKVILPAAVVVGFFPILCYPYRGMVCLRSNHFWSPQLCGKTLHPLKLPHLWSLTSPTKQRVTQIEYLSVF
jgi:hypothetical protein